MTREMEIEILMEDRCTKSEAEKHLKNGEIADVSYIVYEGNEYILARMN